MQTRDQTVQLGLGEGPCEGHRIKTDPDDLPLHGAVEGLGAVGVVMNPQTVLLLFG